MLKLNYLKTKRGFMYRKALNQPVLGFMKYLVLLLAILCFKVSSSQTKITVDQIVYDMVGNPVRDDVHFKYPWGANESFLHGLPKHWDWYHGARPNNWTNPGTNTAVSSWGQVFESANGSPVTDVRFQIRNHYMYVFTNGKWVLAEDVSSDIEAGLFRESNYGWTGLISSKNENNNGGGVSYSIKPNYCLHWFKQVWGNKKRYKLPNNFDAIFIRFEIRMIHNINKATSVADAKYLAAIGADYYPFPESTGTENNPSIVISRHKYLSTEWLVVTAYIAGPLPSSVDEFRKEILSRPLPPNVEYSLIDTK